MKRLALLGLTLGAGRLLYSAIGLAVRASDDATEAAARANTAARLATEQTVGLDEIREQVKTDLAVLADHHAEMFGALAVERAAMADVRVDASHEVIR